MKSCEKGSTVLSFLSEKTRKSNHFADVITKAALSTQLQYLKTLSVGLARVRTHYLLHGSPILNQLS